MAFASWTFIIFIIFGNVCYGQRARSKVSFVDNLIFFISICYWCWSYYIFRRFVFGIHQTRILAKELKCFYIKKLLAYIFPMDEFPHSLF